MPQAQTETLGAGGFLASRATNTRSMDNVVVAPGTAVRVATLAARRDSDQTFINYNPTGTPPGGGQIRGVFYETTDQSGTGTPTKRTAMVARDAEVNKAEMDWNGLSTGQIAQAVTSLASLGIIVREGV